ncbi:protein B4 [Fundulus heteroclitus]|uniref:protein B4 n=1 Tax=Fundulus heteroclitus TaxID=8078 RepID=UPI00165AFA2F|nr:protein B4 [Fundulus heteroclitus]
MPPKKQAAAPADPEPSSNAAAEDGTEKKATAPAAAAVRKVAAHPSTAIMVKEALTDLDSRKGVSSQAIQNYIKQKHPTVDPVRLKHFVRRALKKGLENGTLVRPVHATVTTGAQGKFRLAPKVKEVKRKNENSDPNVQKAPSPTEVGAKKSKAAGATKKKKSTNEKTKSTENPTNSKKETAAPPSKVPAAKKPKAKVKGTADGGSNSPKSKTAKAKGATAEKKPPRKAAKTADDAPAPKAAGKRVKKAV